MGAHGTLDLPEGVEGTLDAETVYDPPNLTFPFGAYICVVDVDAGTGQVKVRRFIAVDDCGVRINPMIVEGQIHGGLADGVGMALMELISFDEDGNCLNGSFMDYLIPTALECPDWELGETVTPVAAPPAGREGRRRVGHRRIAAGRDERDRGRAAPVRRQPHGHARHPRAGVGRDERARGAAAVMRSETAGRADALTASRTPFAVATVVRRQRPSSVRPGDSAIVTADGTIDGFVGGACAEESVRLHALRVLETGEPLLLRIVPGEDEGPAQEGAVTVSNPCLSGGALEIFLEPHLPAPRVVIVGRHADRARARAAGRPRSASTRPCTAARSRSRSRTTTRRSWSHRTATVRRRP